MPIDFERIDAILFDMDGVWFVGEAPVPGAAEALARVRERGLPCRFITNTTTATRDALAGKMRRLGLPVDAVEIINAPRATSLYLASLGNPSCHLLVHDDARADLSCTLAAPGERPDVVVVGDIGERWSYPILNEAFRMLVEGASLVAMHKGRYWQVEDGLALDIGAFVAALEYASGKEAVLVGKPSPTIFRSALDDLDVEPGRAVMVGDDVHSDVGGAQAVGIGGVLVRTGKYRDDLVARAGVTPDLVVDSVAALGNLL